jgi:hypothetical protein
MKVKLNKKLVIIIVSVLIVVGSGIGVGAWYFEGKEEQSDNEARIQFLELLNTASAEVLTNDQQIRIDNLTTDLTLLVSLGEMTQSEADLQIQKETNELKLLNYLNSELSSVTLNSEQQMEIDELEIDLDIDVALGNMTQEEADDILEKAILECKIENSKDYSYLDEFDNIFDDEDSEHDEDNEDD